MSNERKARIEIEAGSSRLDRGLADAYSKMQRFGRDAEKLGRKQRGRSQRKDRGDFGFGMVAGAGAKVATAGLDFVADTVGGLFEFEKSLTRFQIAAGKSGTEMFRFRQEILNVSKATGVSSAEILAGAQTYVDLTGDIKGAQQATSSFARIAQASGASVSDVAQATAAMQMSGKLLASDIEAVWSGLITQGKAGAVSVKDMAGELATLMPMMAKFSGGTGADGIRDMGAAFQVVRRGAGSASEASTKLQSLVGSLIKNSPKLRKAGINVFKFDAKTKKRELIAFRDIIGQIAKKNLDSEKLGKIIGTDKESLQALDMLTQQMALYDDLKSKGMDTSSVGKDLETYLSSPVGKIERAVENIKVKLAEALTPERIERFANAAVKAADAFASIVDAVENLVDDTGLQEIYKGDYKGAIAAKYMRNTAMMSPEQKRSRAAEYQKTAAQMQASGDLDESSELQMIGMRTAADRLLKQSDTWGSLAGVRTDSYGTMAAPTPETKPLDLKQLAGEIAAAVANRPIIVKMDGNTAARTIAEVPYNRKPRAR